MQVIPSINFVEAETDSGVSDNTTTTPAQVAFQEITITTRKSGRVQLMALGSYVSINHSLVTGESAVGYFVWRRDGVDITDDTMVLEIQSENDEGTGGLILRMPAGVLNAHDNPGIGTFEYTLWFCCSTSDTRIRASNVKIAAYEMGT